MNLQSLSRVYEADGPFVSLYLDTTSAVEDAATRWETRWKNVLRDLDAHSVDAETVAALSAARGDHAPGNTRVLVAANGRVLIRESLPQPPPVEIVQVGALPHLLPLIAALSVRIPHVVVLVDRRGADVIAYSGLDALPAEQQTVQSDVWPVHKTGAGGWSSKRYDSTVENSWEESAAQVAALVDSVTKDVGARAVVASGDGRAVQLLAEHLPEQLKDGFTVVEGGGRAVDGSDEVVADAVLREVAAVAARDTLQLLDRFAEGRGRDDTGCEGLDPTVAALRMSQVGTLVLTEGFDGGQPMWFGPRPDHLAARADDLRDLGVSDPRQAAAVDVVVRAALGTGADVRIVPGDLPESPRAGIGAILRFATAPGTRA